MPPFITKDDLELAFFLLFSMITFGTVVLLGAKLLLAKDEKQDPP